MVRATRISDDEWQAEVAYKAAEDRAIVPLVDRAAIAAEMTDIADGLHAGYWGHHLDLADAVDVAIDRLRTLAARIAGEPQGDAS